jgi:large subunit ribosomal protein L13
MAEKKTAKKSTAEGGAKASAKAGEAKTQAAAQTAAKTRRAQAKPATPKKALNPFSKARPFATYMAPKGEIQRQWFVVDADGLVLGRAASRIAFILRGKHKPVFTPHTDTGDFVVVINAEKIVLTGKKELEKPYRNHSMHPGGLKTAYARDVRSKTPEELLIRAVQRMIPRSPLGREMFLKLKVYAGPTHPHQAQRPQPLTLPQ